MATREMTAEEARQELAPAVRDRQRAGRHGHMSPEARLE